jgi:hypothetical protein
MQTGSIFPPRAAHAWISAADGCRSGGGAIVVEGGSGAVVAGGGCRGAGSDGDGGVVAGGGGGTSTAATGVGACGDGDGVQPTTMDRRRPFTRIDE